MSLLEIVQVFTAIALLGFGFLAVTSKTLIRAVISLSALSMLSALAFALMKAPDVAITEAVIGSGIVTSLFVFTLLKTKEEVKNEEI